MQTKLIEILFSATGWMTSVQIAEKGKWRSASHVGVELQLMEKAGRVVRRKSPTVKQSNGMPATEWRHVDKRFDGDACNQQNAKSETQAPLVSIDKTQPVIRDSRTTEEENLRQQVAHLTDQLAAEKSNYARLSTYLTQAERQRDDHFADAESANKKLADLDDDLRRHVQRAEVAERNRDDLKKQSEENHRLFLAAISDLAKVNETLELDPNDGGAEPIISAIDDLKSQLETAETANIRWLDLAREYECKTIPELRVFIGALEERINHLKNESNLISLNLQFVEGDDLVEKVCTVMHERIHAPKIVATNAAQFVVKTPSKPPRFTKKHAKAQATAMSAARQHGFAEVFALVPVGKAIRGAEWVAK